ncbi:MAG: PTS sugar transporter subunit IIA [Kiritimatiellales bacterium]|nr:PTS sugar transporter subunit IIA [Kiritimatiellales bacterium]
MSDFGNGGKAEDAADSASLASILSRECVVLLDCESKKAALTQLVDLLAETPFVLKRDELLRGVFEREELMSTGIGYGIGVPHVRLDSVKDVVMAVGICKEPIKDYTSLDGKPVQIICMLVARKNQHSQYLRMLSTISSHLKSQEMRECITGANDAEKVFRLLTDSQQD